MTNNRQFSLADVVSIEAWYAKFSEDNRQSEFFLHIKFQDGVFGADPEIPVRFKIRLKKAEVVVVPEEPIKVPRRHVRRDRIHVEAKQTVRESKLLAGDAEAGVELLVSPTRPKASARVKAKGKVAASKQTEVEKTLVTHSGMSIEHSYKDDCNVWAFSPVLGEHLLGQAFHGTEAMMLLEHKDELSKIAPTVKVRVTCLREDIHVEDIQPKQDKRNMWGKGMGEAKKSALAEEIIREELARNGLEFEGDLDAFSRVTVAEAFAAEE